ncbi:MAG TPA: hypothetical protein VKC57_12815 [Ktedonobacterales bacterium]|nr:hypothetical protein [Ktedonobacterales bacterium]
MAAPIQVEATVSPEGKIEISVPELAPGQRVRVSIQPEEATPLQPQHVLDIVENLPGHRLFKTADEVDAYIREERDSWDR